MYVCVVVVMELVVEEEVVMAVGGLSPKEERLVEKRRREGMQSGVTLREERSGVRRGSSGRDHHLASLSLPFSRAVILNRPAVTTVPPPDDDTH